MPVDRSKWISTFRRGSPPTWACPSCPAGVLQPKDKNGLIEEESAESKRDEEMHPGDWEPDWYRGHFAAHFTCEKCKEVVLVAGTTRATFATNPEEPNEIEIIFKPTLFAPSPPLFAIPDKCPPHIRDELKKAWNLFWADAAACANRIRSCIEMILTDQGVKRFALSKKSRRVRLALHDRILIYKAREPGLAESMMAVKWLGNAGSHEPEALPETDIFSGFDLLEHVVVEVYEQRSKVLDEIRQDLIRRKGRPRKRRANATGA